MTVFAAQASGCAQTPSPAIHRQVTTIGADARTTRAWLRRIASQPKAPSRRARNTSSTAMFRIADRAVASASPACRSDPISRSDNAILAARATAATSTGVRVSWSE